MNTPFDGLETQSAEARAARIAEALPKQIALAQGLSGYADLGAHEAAGIASHEALARLPVLRKSDLPELQALNPPFGGLTTRSAAEFDHVFQSPGPINEPGMRTRDWWRFGRFLHAAGMGPGDIIQNCFGYHMTPAGLMFENAAGAVGAADRLDAPLGLPALR